MNLKTKTYSRLLLTIIFIWLATLFSMASAQDTLNIKYPSVIIHDGDTVFAYTIEQAKDLKDKNDSLKTYRRLYYNSEYKVDTLLAQIEEHKKVHKQDSVIISSTNGLLNESRKETKIEKERNLILTKEVKKFKAVSVGLGGLAILGFTLYFTK